MSINYNVDTSSELLLELSTVLNLCELVDSPRSLTVALLLKYREYDQVVRLEIDANNYEDHQHFADDYLVTSILQKSVYLPTSCKTKDAAVSSFFEAEQLCADTNRRFRDTMYHEHPPALRKMRRIIKNALGPLNQRVLGDILDNSRFGPGATTGISGRGVVPSKKFDADMHLTHELVPFYRLILGDRWWEIQKTPTIVAGNKFTTVPKNAKTDRGICIEPTLNVFLQLGIGTYIRDRLKRLGTYLKSPRNVSTLIGLERYKGGVSWERNQDLAQRAYAEELSTIDLSKASDTLSIEAVKFLLPDDWYHLLQLARSSTTSVDGKLIPLEKFSSMGNGYTFELETLIFRAAVLAVVPLTDQHLTSVFGDDIICPRKYADKVIGTLEALGFSVNRQKSFLAGNFFESCGADFFKGQPVRPFYLRRQKTGNRFLPYQVQITNALRIYANRRGYGLYCDARFKPLWLTLKQSCPQQWRACMVPETFGDTGIICSFSECNPRRLQSQIEGYQVRYRVFKPVFADRKTIGRLLCALAGGISVDDPLFTRGKEPKRGFLRKVSSKVGQVVTWPEGWDWVA